MRDTDSLLALCAGRRWRRSRPAAAAVHHGGDYGGQHPDYAKALAGSPPPLAALHKQANQLLPGGTERLRKADRGAARLPGRGQRLGLLVRPLPRASSRPCRSSRRLRQAGRLPRRQLQDSDDAAATFLGEEPRPLPQLHRPRQGHRRESLGAASASPTPPSTTAAGKLVYLKQGPYRDESELEADIAPLRPPSCESG